MQNHSGDWALPSPFSGSANFSNFQVFSELSPRGVASRAARSPLLSPSSDLSLLSQLSGAVIKNYQLLSN